MSVVFDAGHHNYEMFRLFVNPSIQKRGMYNAYIPGGYQRDTGIISRTKRTMICSSELPGLFRSTSLTLGHACTSYVLPHRCFIWGGFLQLLYINLAFGYFWREVVATGLAGMMVRVWLFG